jgi:hypothetical protein
VGVALLPVVLATHVPESPRAKTMKTRQFRFLELGIATKSLLATEYYGFLAPLTEQLVAGRKTHGICLLDLLLTPQPFDVEWAQ